MFKASEVVARGLSAARMRINVLASNIANSETTRTPEGGPYRRKDVVQVAEEAKGSFQSSLDQMTLSRPRIAAVVEDQSPPRMVYQPGHPDANDDGFVAYPNVNVVTTMTDLMSASRLYQANATAMQSLSEMARAARNISIRF